MKKIDSQISFDDHARKPCVAGDKAGRGFCDRGSRAEQGGVPCR